MITLISTSLPKKNILHSLTSCIFGVFFVFSIILLPNSAAAAEPADRQAFIERFYQNILGRAADEGGMQSWLELMQTESSAEVSFGFFNSQEFSNLNLDNGPFVDILYQTLFDRPADDAGYQVWISQLNNGALRDLVIYGFLRSQEFANLADRFGVVAFSSSDNAEYQLKLFIRRFYTLVLEREPDVGGYNSWFSGLASGTKEGGDIAKGFFNSQEFFNRGTDNSTFIDISYRTFFDREADIAGKDGWLTQMANGVSRNQVLDGFIGSQEFTNLLRSFGLLPDADIIPVDGTTTYQGTGQLNAQGGTITAGDASITIPAKGLLRPINITISEIPLPAALPAGLILVDDAVDIAIDKADQDLINAPLSITLNYNDEGLSNEKDLLIFHYDEETGYSPVRITKQDTDANKITFESRTFSPFVLTAIDLLLPTKFNSDFTATSNGWDINNFGSYFAPGGNCLGMSGYAAWFFNNKKGENLHAKFTPAVARLTSIRAHLAQSQSWGIDNWRNEQKLDAAHLGRVMKAYMAILKRPLIFLMGTDGAPAHASIVYGYDEAGFKFYDVNVKDVEQTVTYNGTIFGTYGSFNSFGYVAVNSLGRTEDFKDLTTEAVAGFTSSSDLQLVSFDEGDVFNVREAPLVGFFPDTSINVEKLYVEVKGVGRQVAVENGQFSDKIEVSNGDNTIVLLAGVDIAKQSNWYKNAATLVRTIKGEIPVTSILVTLTWDQADTDVDLYITEPNDGETMWFGNTQTSNGLTLDLDNRTGFGPEHGTLITNSGSALLEGNYRVRAHYYGNDTGIADTPITGKATIVINEGEDNQIVKESTFTISNADSSAEGPEGTGTSWAEIALVNVVGGVIFIPD